jgi:hypothetical protein
VTKFPDIHECLLQSNERYEPGISVQLANGTFCLSVDLIVVHGRVPHGFGDPCATENIYITIPVSHESAEHRARVCG